MKTRNQVVIFCASVGFFFFFLLFRFLFQRFWGILLLSWGGERKPTACFRVVSTLATCFLSYYPSIHHSLSSCCFKLLQQSVNCCHFEFYHPSFDCFGFIVGFFFLNSAAPYFISSCSFYGFQERWGARTNLTVWRKIVVAVK